MEKVVVFPRQDGGVIILVPTMASGLTVEQVAKKDVPQGLPYNIIDRALVPADRTFRDAWEYDFSAPDGYGDPASYWGAQQ